MGEPMNSPASGFLCFKSWLFAVVDGMDSLTLPLFELALFVGSLLLLLSGTNISA